LVPKAVLLVVSVDMEAAVLELVLELVLGLQARSTAVLVSVPGVASALGFTASVTVASVLDFTASVMVALGLVSAVADTEVPA
jgi:hypothetical protein